MNIEKFIGCLIGLAIGDSLGASREGARDFREISEIGRRYTDDTAMMIGVAESLIECGGFNGANMAEKFIKNYEKEPWRGYGLGPPKIFHMIKKGRNWDELLDRELFSEGSFGNGSAMRVAPIGLFYYDDLDELRAVAYKSSQITHSHPLAMEGAALQAYAVSLALREEKDFIGKLKDFVRIDIYKRKIESIEYLLDKKHDRKSVVKELGNGIEAVRSVPTAIFSFPSNRSFRESLIYSVSLGGDADTIGAMTGAIAGAFYGSSAIPEEWKEKLENREYITWLAERIGEIKSRQV
jgi:poly(ADP-ribose) glycohydrolase ARH3